MPNTPDIPWALLLPLSSGAGLIAFEKAGWSPRWLTSAGCVAFVLCGTGFAQTGIAGIPEGVAVTTFLSLVGLVCLIMSWANSTCSDTESPVTGTRATLMLFGLGCTALLAYAETLPTFLIAFVGFISVQTSNVDGDVVSQDEQLKRGLIPETPSIDSDRGHPSAAHQNLSMLAILMFFVGASLLYSLTSTWQIAEIARILKESYEPAREDLVAGAPSILGIVGVALVVFAFAVLLAVPLLHADEDRLFAKSAGWQVGWTAIACRAFGTLGLLRIMRSGLPGYELDLQIVLIIVATLFLVGGAIRTARINNLRGILHGLWMISGGILTLTLAIGARQSAQINIDRWHFPEFAEVVLMGLAISSGSLMIGLCIEWLLNNAGERTQFVEDFCDIGRRHPFWAVMLLCSLMTLCSIPPMPSFWHLTFVLANGFVPQSEAPATPVLVPSNLVLLVMLITVILVALAARRLVELASVLLFARSTPAQVFSNSETARCSSLPTMLVATSLSATLIIFGLNPSTMIWLFHVVNR